MTPEDQNQVREIIRQELLKLSTAERWVFQQHIQMFPGKNWQTGRDTGSILATEGGATGQKLGFWGKTPTTQPATVSDPSANVDSLKTAVDAIIDSLQSIGLMQ